MFDLTSYLKENRKKTNRQLEAYLSSSSGDAKISQAMFYSVMAGGKRLRPVLCIAAAQTVGGSSDTVLPIACSLELIHTYSLIHDDLPAMDDDVLRRGSATCHVQFDEATAILAGDALLTLAFEIMANAGCTLDGQKQDTWMRVIARVASAAGHRGMIEGQMRDMAAEGVTVSKKELEFLHRLKTGRMIEVSVESGAIVSGASDTQRQALFSYARNIGLAFQVVDDILNVNGDPHLLGKTVGTDKLRGKNTYPSLLGVAGAEEMAFDLVNNALMALDVFDKKAEPLRAIAKYVIERNR